MIRILALALLHDLGRWCDRHGHVWAWSIIQRLGAGPLGPPATEPQETP